MSHFKKVKNDLSANKAILKINQKTPSHFHKWQFYYNFLWEKSFMKELYNIP